MKNYFLIAANILLSFTLPSIGIAQSSGPLTFKNTYRDIQQVTYSWNKRALQGFNLKVWMNNSMVLGDFAFDAGYAPATCGSDGVGLEYPAGSCIDHLFAGAPWIGAIAGGKKLVTEAFCSDNYQSEVYPEKKDSLRDQLWHTSIYDTVNDPNRPGYYKLAMNRARVDDDGDGLVDEDPVDGIDNDGDWNPATDDIGADGIPDSLEIGCKGIYNPLTNPDPAYDNYEPAAYDSCHPNANGSFPLKKNKNSYTEKNDIPDHGEPHVDEDGAAFSASDYYSSATDTFQNGVSPRRNLLGLKIGQRSLAWNADTPAEGIVFFQYDYTNISQSTWQDPYLGWFANPGSGPVNVSGHYRHNYSAYDTATNTAYAFNPIDSGSTPIGITLAGTSYPADNLKHVFRWFASLTDAKARTSDDSIYSLLSGEKVLIDADQSPQNLSDTWFVISCGPFPAVDPGNKLQITYALVSGKNIGEMLANARRAKDIYDAGFFIMPTVEVSYSGTSHTVNVTSHSSVPSPSGAVTSARFYYGTETNHYTDSIVGAGQAALPPLSPGQVYYIRARAIDEYGYESAISDEASTLPNVPKGVTVVDGEVSIRIQWDASIEWNVAGYNIYRRASLQDAYAKINANVVDSASFVDSTVRGDSKYYYRVTSIDSYGNESAQSDSSEGNLNPPATPTRFIIGPNASLIRLVWDSDTEGDLAGYNIYRADKDSTNLSKLNASIVTAPRYTDSSVIQNKVYDYYLEAIDTTGAVSSRAKTSGHTVAHDQGVLVICAGSVPSNSIYKSFYQTILDQYHITVFYSLPSIQGAITNTLDNAEKYSAILWFQDNYPLGSMLQASYPTGLKGYLLGGGRLLVMGRQLPSKNPLLWYPFLSDIFGIDSLTRSDTIANFAGAMAYHGFPSLTLDQSKLDTSNGQLKYVDRLSEVSADRVIYSYHTNPSDTTLEGLPVGVISKDTSYRAYYMSFPLYFLDTASARALMAKVLSDFGIVTGIPDNRQNVPTNYYLYQAYPNPFNPATTIRYALPVQSNVRLVIYNVLGQIVKVLIDGVQEAGYKEITWNASNNASGVYFYRIDAADPTKRIDLVKKVMLIR
jgi:hypothetical protein